MILIYTCINCVINVVAVEEETEVGIALIERPLLLESLFTDSVVAGMYSYLALITFMITSCIPSSLQFQGEMTAGRVSLNSTISVKGQEFWMSKNGTFALGFYPVSPQLYVLGILYVGIPGNNNKPVWMANRDEPVSEEGFLTLGQDGNLQLGDGQSTIWMAETTGLSVESGEMQDSGNFVLYNSDSNIVWQSFASPTDTLLPGQELTQSLNLTSWNSSTDVSRGRYFLKMMQEPESLKIALNYNIPYESFNYSYWSGPKIYNTTGFVVAFLNLSGSFSMSCGEPSKELVYIYHNRNNLAQDGRALRRITLEHDGNLILYRWDANVSSRWIVDWVAVSDPYSIAGVCGNGICRLDTKGNPNCACPPGSNLVDSSKPYLGCFPLNSSPDCSNDNNNVPSRDSILTVPQTNYYGGSSVIFNYSNISAMSACRDLCLYNCSCVASVYGVSNMKPYCWTLGNLLFGGLQDPNYTFFMKVSLINNSGMGYSNEYPVENSKYQSHLKMLLLGTILGAVFLVCVFILICSSSIFMIKNRRSLDAYIFVPGTPVNFSFVDLQIATNNFRERLGTGGFGTVYKGTLSDGTLIAVKRLERLLPQGERQFETEVTTIGAIHHRNLVRLCGYCSEGLQRLLVYEFLPNGSLDRWLFGSSSNDPRFLDWDTRYSISLATAQGIAYLHEQCRDRIIHCDIKPENILLDENFCSKVSDFGLAKLMEREHSHVMTMVRGTRGYLAPEWVTNRPITVKADVYSYGMVLLEIIGGRRNLDMSLGPKKFFFPGWAFEEMMKGNASKVADKRICGELDAIQLIRVLRVAFWCIQDDVNMRPSMGLVVKMLEGSVEVKVPPMPQSVIEIMEEGLPNIYKDMRRDLMSDNGSTSTDGMSSISFKEVYSDAAFDYSSISIPR